MDHDKERLTTLIFRLRSSFAAARFDLGDFTKKSCMFFSKPFFSGIPEIARTSLATSCEKQEASKSQCPLWQLRRLPEHPVTVRHGGSRERAVSDEELRSLAPGQVIRKALPNELADKLLRQLLDESKKSWQSTSWVIHGKTHATPWTSAMYNLDITSAETRHKDTLQSPGEEESRATCIPSSLLKEAAHHIHVAVKQHRPHSTWSPTLAFGNRYDDGRACVGWHSDFLNSLGPRPIIVGLSLGACRRFCLRRTVDGMVRVLEPGIAFGCVRLLMSLIYADIAKVVTIPMPHNTVAFLEAFLN